MYDTAETTMPAGAGVRPVTGPGGDPMREGDDSDPARERNGNGDTRPPRHRLSLFGRSIALPASRSVRIALGLALCVGGLFAFLPILGLWMIPLGLAVLSVDIRPVRRHSSRGAVWLRRRYPKLAAKMFPKDR